MVFAGPDLGNYAALAGSHARGPVSTVQIKNRGAPEAGQSLHPTSRLLQGPPQWPQDEPRGQEQAHG